MYSTQALQNATVNKETGNITAIISGDIGFFEADDNHKIYIVSPLLKNLKVGDTFPVQLNKALLRKENPDTVTHIIEQNKLDNKGYKKVIEIPFNMLNELTYGLNPNDIDKQASKLFNKYLKDNRYMLKGNLDYNTNQKTGHGKSTALYLLLSYPEGFTKEEYIRQTAKPLPSSFKVINDKIYVPGNNINCPDTLVDCILCNTDTVVRVKYSDEIKASISDKRTFVNDDTDDDDEPKKKRGMRM